MKTNRTLGIIYLILGAIMLIIGFSTPSVIDEFNIYWMVTACLIIPGALISAGSYTGNSAVYLARIVVGSLFVVSGLIKANDAMGFAFKLEEYFDPNSLGAFWAQFHDWAIPIAIFVAGLETMLGLAVLMGIKPRLTNWILLAMTIFFGWLTWFTASCNDSQMAAMAAGESFDRVCVTDCGCFGDALRGSVGRSLTPWESFYKDLALFFLVLILVVRQNLVRRRDTFIIFPISLLCIVLFGGWLFGWMFPTWFTLFAMLLYYLITGKVKKDSTRTLLLICSILVLSFAFVFYTYTHLPIKDYRPYAVGKNIKQQMMSAEELGLQPTVYATVYVLENVETTETKTINSKEYLEQEIWKDKSWKIVHSSDEPIVIQRGYEPPIATFSITDNEGFEAGEAILNIPNYVFMLVEYDLEKANKEVQDELNTFAMNSEAAGYGFFAVSSTGGDYKRDFIQKYQIPYDIYSADGIFLKTIIRSNPGLLLLKDGTVVMKWHYNDIPEFQEVLKNYLN